MKGRLVLLLVVCLSCSSTAGRSAKNDHLEGHVRGDHRTLCPDFRRRYCQTNYTIDERLDDLMSHMTNKDKIRTMSQRSVSGWYHDGTPLVGQRYVWWNEALHGLEPRHVPNGPCGKVCPTLFAEANALSCAWNRSLWRETAAAISTEARAYFHEGANDGLTLYAPQINLASNPLWGRNMECPGEDPFLTSVFAKEFVWGLQGDHPTILKAVATPKHFVGHFFEGDGSDPWGNGTIFHRYANDTRFSLRDLQEYYLQPFRAALVEAKAASVMCAYLSVNGVPMCANGFLLNRVLRQSWNWTGMVVSDCDAIANMRANMTQCYLAHDYSLTGSMAVQDAVRAGCDQNCGSTFETFGRKALRSGRLSSFHLNVSVRRMLRLLFRLGLFDPPHQTPYSSLGWKDVGSAQHKSLALEGARQSIVLLQNGNQLLPFPKGKRMLVAGPLFNRTIDLLGNYHGSVCHDGTTSCLTSLVKWITMLNRGGTTVSAQGVPPGCAQDDTGISDVVKAALTVDYVVVALGGTCHENEGADRDDLTLPGSQVALFNALVGLGKPMAVVVVHGGPYALDRIVAHKEIALLQTGFAGEAGPQAIAEVLFGEVNPSGKLTTTVYPSNFTKGKPMSGTSWVDPSLRPNAQSEGRTHMYYTGKPLFPFGFGLSFTTFSMEVLAGVSLQRRLGQAEDTVWRIRLTNTGQSYGREIVQAYWFPPPKVDTHLKRKLYDFQAVELAPAQSKVLSFSRKHAVDSIATVAENGDTMRVKGSYTVFFSRGYKDEIQMKINVQGKDSKVIERFPSPWVEGQEVTVDACVEGSTDITRHTEPFLLAYKQWRWNVETGSLIHVNSGRCLAVNPSTLGAVVQTCDGENSWQQWHYDSLRFWLKSKPEQCLFSASVDAQQVRSRVFLSKQCKQAESQWEIAKNGWVRLRVPQGQTWTEQEGLCLALRAEGIFNNKG